MKYTNDEAVETYADSIVWEGVEEQILTDMLWFSVLKGGSLWGKWQGESIE